MNVTETSELTELLESVGEATPAAVFLVDARGGGSVPLNERARRQGAGDDASTAFVSPVDRSRRVIGYLSREADDEETSLVSSLVALLAAVAASEAGASPGTTLDGGVPTDDPDEADGGAARWLVDSAASTTGASRAVLHVRTRQGDWQVAAAHGVDAATLPSLRSGGRLASVAVGGEPAWLEVDGAEDESWMEAGRAVLVPVHAGGEPIALLTCEGLTAATADTCVDVLTRLADRAVARSTAERFLADADAPAVGRRHADLALAQRVQRCLLPAPRFAMEGLELAGGCRPSAQLGGDYFGYRQTGPDELVVTVFDVAGHGIGAAVCMAMVRATVLGELKHSGSPADLLSNANDRVWSDLAGTGLFVTSFLARFDVAQGQLTYANAGHAPPVHWSAAERCFRSLCPGSLPLGLLGTSHYGEARAPFGQGDLLVFYTDGIVDALSPDGEPFGRSRVVGVVHRLRRRSARHVLRALWNELDRFTDGRPLRDDATLLVVRAPHVRDETEGGTARGEGDEN